MTAAKKSDWNNKPMPSQHATIPVRRTDYSLDQMAAFHRGYLPAQMEDKWFIYWADGSLYFHRSWTGYCLFILPISPNGVTDTVEVNRDPDQYGSTDDQYDAALVLYLVDLLLLRKIDAQFPCRETNSNKRTMQTWHMVGRAMLGEIPDEEETPRDP